MYAVAAVTGALCASGTIFVHLLTSPDPKDRPQGHVAKFQECAECREVDVDFGDSRFTGKISRDPVVEIRGERSEAARIWVTSPVYEPDNRRYTLWLKPDSSLADEIGRVDADYNHERALFYRGETATNAGWVGSHWKRWIPVGGFGTEDEARDLASFLCIDPELVPYDAARDEEKRKLYLRAVIREFRRYPDPLERMKVDQPRAYEFFTKHPEYWSELEE